MDSFLNIVQYSYIRELKKPVSPQLRIMESYARHNKIPIIDWYSAEAMEFVIALLKPTSILELGTAIGYSAIRIAQQLSPEAKIITIEKSPDSFAKAKAHIEQSGFSPQIQMLLGEAKELLPEIDGQFDCVFLDADKRDYMDLFNLAFPKTKIGGVIIVDNLLWHGFVAEDDANIPENYISSANNIREFNDMFFKHSSLKTLLLPIGDGLGMGIKLKD